MDDFIDDFDDCDFMDDPPEDSFDENLEPEDCFDDGPEAGNELDEADSCDIGLTAQEAFFFGTAIAFGYGEGLEAAERRRLEKEMEDDIKDREINSKT